MRISIIKNNDGSIKPANVQSAEELDKLKPGEYQAEIKKPRNYRFLKKFFALIKAVYSMQESHKTVKSLRHELTIRAGYYSIIYDNCGRLILDPESVSFSSIDETKFQDIYSGIFNAALEYLNEESPATYNEDDLNLQIEYLLSFV